MTGTIAFDLDGTLVDSIHHIHGAVLTALTELDLAPVTLDAARGFVGRGLPVLVSRVLTHIGAPQALHPKLTERVMVHYVNTPSDPASLYPGVPEALEALRNAGHRLTICTNKPFAATQACLRDTGLAACFADVIAGDSLDTRKPEPAMLHAALAGADQALFIGDSETDAETAERAHVSLLLFTEGYRKAPVSELPHKAAFSRFADLPELVARHM